MPCRKRCAFRRYDLTVFSTISASFPSEFPRAGGRHGAYWSLSGELRREISAAIATMAHICPLSRQVATSRSIFVADDLILD